MALYISKYFNNFGQKIEVNCQNNIKIELDTSTFMLSINGIDKILLSGAYNIVYLGKNILLVMDIDNSLRYGAVLLNIKDAQNPYVVRSFNLVSMHPEIDVWEFYIRKDEFYWFGYERKFIQTEEMEWDITNKISEIYDNIIDNQSTELYQKLESMIETYYPNESSSQSLEEIKKDSLLWKLIPKKQLSFKL